MFQRATDFAMLALIGVATMLAVQASWEPPEITPAMARDHVGQTVRVEGMALDVRYFDDGSAAFLLVADGMALHARTDAAEGLAETTWLHATGDILRIDGAPMLDADTWQVRRPPLDDHTSLGAIAVQPAAHVDRLVNVPGHVEADHLHDGPHAILLEGGPAGGPAVLQGIVRYQPTCACHVLHVAEALPWSP